VCFPHCGELFILFFTQVLTVLTIGYSRTRLNAIPKNFQIHEDSNLNQWDISQIYRQEQFYTKASNDYNNFTVITVPATRSREAAPEFIIDRGAVRSIKLQSGAR